MEDIEKQLRELYYEQGKSWKYIKKILNISSKSLRKYKKDFNFKPLSKEEIVKKREKTCRERYGCNNPMQSKGIVDKAKTTIRNENVVEKRRLTCIKRYGVDIPSQNKQVKDKMKQTCINRYGVTSVMHIDKVKSIVREKSRIAFATGIPKQKEYRTRALNNSWNKSKPEEEAYKLLVEKFGVEDVIRQYRSEFYPFNCDFYIKSKDLYIEYQGTWVHGKEPFDPNNENHKSIIEKWQSKDTSYFNYAIGVWTNKDPLKRQKARDNYLNWKEYFSLTDLREDLNLLDI